MKFKSQLIDQASGSVGGLTASRNKGGNYFRARSIPTNPNTTLQQAVRGYMADINAYWRNTLTAAQRASWAAVAANVPVTDKLGDQRYLTGMQWFIGMNVLRLQAGLAIQAAAPTNNARMELSQISVDAVDATANEVDIAWATGAWDDSDDDTALLVFVSRPQNASVNYFKGPYQYAGKIEGDSTTAPTSPQSITSPFEITAGQKVFVKIVGVNGADLHSAPFRDNGIGA